MTTWRTLSMVVIALSPAALLVHCVSANSKSSRNLPHNIALFQVAAANPVRTPTAQFYVAPDGLPTGDGSMQNPWDLATALAQPRSIRPGAVIWVRGGSYGTGTTIFYSRLVGRRDSPIIVRQYPGERATINGWLQIGCCDQDPHPDQGGDTWFWGLEFTSDILDRTGAPAGPPLWGASALQNAVDVWAPGTKLINLVIHDARQGIGIWKEATNSEVYGNLIYDNGFQASDRGHGHGIYVQNNVGKKLIADNIIFNQFGVGIHAYGTENSDVKNITEEGNIVFNNGVISDRAQNDDNILFASGTGLENIVVQNNYTYHTPAGNIGYSRVGWQFDQQNKNVIVANNYWIGGDLAIMLNRWDSAVFTGNTIYSKDQLLALMDVLPAQNPKVYQWDRNTYFGSGRFSFAQKETNWQGWTGSTNLDGASSFNSGRPTGTWTFVRGNRYEPGRANIAVYNWELHLSVPVDLSQFLTVGAKYEIRDAENFYARPVFSGVYDGRPVSLPMDGLKPAEAHGQVPTVPAHTAPEFGAFIVQTVQ